MANTKTHHIVFIAFNGVQSLDISGPWDVFDTANRILLGSQKRYALHLIGLSSLNITSSSGLQMHCDETLDSYHQPINTLLVCGGDGIYDACKNNQFIQSIQQLAAVSCRVGSVCTGAFALAAAGLLNGRRAATHWAFCERLAKDYPDIEVDCDAIFVCDERFYTSAGVTAGIDMALAMVEQDCGYEVAMLVAQNLVMFLRRPGGQAQFSAASRRQNSQEPSLRELQLWMVEHLDDDLSVAALAHRSSMSQRNFSRVFTAEIGTSPGQYVQQLRVEVARQQLEQTNRSVSAVSRVCGFGSELSMRRSFQKVLGITPNEYRARFKG